MLVYLNYKEPLKPVENGHGYLGTLAQTDDGEFVQCHICGQLCYNLGSHVFNFHNLKADEYRQKFQLGRRTPLCSDVASKDYKNRALDRMAKMTPDERQEQIDNMRAVAKLSHSKGNPRSLEALNKDGMCPDQLISHILKCAEALSKNPTHKDFTEFYGGKYVGAINRTFGSWNSAKKQANLAPNKSGSRIVWNKGQSRYTDEMLLEYLSNHYKQTKKPPTASDWKRRFLPDYHIYLKRFGSIRKAREMAGIPNMV